MIRAIHDKWSTTLPGIISVLLSFAFSLFFAGTLGGLIFLVYGWVNIFIAWRGLYMGWESSIDRLTLLTESVYINNIKRPYGTEQDMKTIILYREDFNNPVNVFFWEEMLEVLEEILDVPLPKTRNEYPNSVVLRVTSAKAN